MAVSSEASQGLLAASRAVQPLASMLGTALFVAAARHRQGLGPRCSCRGGGRGGEAAILATPISSGEGRSRQAGAATLLNVFVRSRDQVRQELWDGGAARPFLKLAAQQTGVYTRMQNCGWRAMKGAQIPIRCVSLAEAFGTISEVGQPAAATASRD